MDFRIQQTVELLLAELMVDYDDFDRVSIPGGAGNIALFEEMALLSKRLHDINMVVLTVHEDCGAGATMDDLKEAISIAKNSLPDVEVRAFYIYLDGHWDEVDAG